jgi:hypothetical protein
MAGFLAAEETAGIAAAPVETFGAATAGDD